MDDLLSIIFAIGTFCALVLFAIAMFVLKIWLVFSLVTSGVKAYKEECGKTYGIERFASGNWFCPKDSIIKK